MVHNSDEDLRKHVKFYILLSTIYIGFVLGLLFGFKGLYILGKYSFQPVLFIIVLAETMKYLLSNMYYPQLDFYLGKKCEKPIKSTFVRLVSRLKVKEGGKTIATVLAMTVVYFLLSVLYGAEIVSKHEETIMFSSLLSVLTVFPICLNLGSNSFFPILMGMKPSNLLESLLSQNIYLTIGGAWIGAMTIPLDWDRPWQVWPIPCSLGAVLGFLLSHIIMTQRVREKPVRKHRA